MRLASAVCLIVTFAILQFSPASACGGGSPFLIDALYDVDIIVEATALDVDERGYSAILHVSRYFKGQAGEYLTVMRFPPTLETAAAVRDYSTGCLYSGNGREWANGDSGYFGLRSNGDGTYSDTASGNVAHFIPSDDRIEFYDFDPQTDSQWHSETLPIAEFENLLLEYGETESTLQPISNPYPLMRFLNITTESGQRYQLNPDRSITPLDPETSPIAISNDGSHVAFRIDDERIGFQYLWLERMPFFEDITNDGGWLIPQPGQSVQFSPDSNFVAVKNDAEITIYMFDNYENGGYGQRMTMQTVAQTDISQPLEETPIVWSADSTTFAYQDGDGIWIWDIFEDGEPVLAITNVLDDSILLDISVSGRYVRYGQSDVWELLDTQSNVSYHNAIATPDESNLIYIQPEFPEGTPDVDRRDNRQCEAPLSQNCPIYISFPLNLDGTGPDIFWYKYDQIALLGCGEDRCYVSSYPWRLAIGNSYNLEIQLTDPLLLVDAFDYDLIYDQPVVSVAGSILEFGFYPSYEREEPSDPVPNLDQLDLSNMLDSPIVDLEWGLPIFYDHNHP